MNRGFIANTALAAVGLGLLFSLGAYSFGLPCLPGYADSGLSEGLGKGAALLAAFKLSLQNLADFLPILAGFAAIFAAALGAPLVMPDPSKRRTLMTLAIAPMTIGLALWIALSGPGSDCAQGSVALNLLASAALGAVALYAAAWGAGKMADRD